MKEIVLATSNSGKIAELQAMLSPLVCIPQSDLEIGDVAETGLSFIENAIIKARHASALSGMPALADDSGLVVEALQGRPGIYSSRFAGEKATDETNIDALLLALNGVVDQARQAYFYCAIALVRHGNDPTPVIVSGQLHGVISKTRSGCAGFGYDPVFYLPKWGCTLAELSSEQKNKISHRAQALGQLKQMQF